MIDPKAISKADDYRAEAIEAIVNSFEFGLGASNSTKAINHLNDAIALLNKAISVIQESK